MSEKTLPQAEPKAAKEKHPADGSDRLGNHLALLSADGDIDSMGREYANRVREYAELGDDDAVFAVLADVYRTELAGGAR